MMEMKLDYEHDYEFRLRIPSTKSEVRFPKSDFRVTVTSLEQRASSLDSPTASIQMKKRGRRSGNRRPGGLPLLAEVRLEEPEESLEFLRYRHEGIG